MSLCPYASRVFLGAFQAIFEFWPLEGIKKSFETPQKHPERIRTQWKGGKSPLFLYFGPFSSNLRKLQLNSQTKFYNSGASQAWAACGYNWRFERQPIHQQSRKVMPSTQTFCMCANSFKKKRKVKSQVSLDEDYENPRTQSRNFGAHFNTTVSSGVTCGNNNFHCK